MESNRIENITKVIEDIKFEIKLHSNYDTIKVERMGDDVINVINNETGESLKYVGLIAIHEYYVELCYENDFGEIGIDTPHTDWRFFGGSQYEQIKNYLQMMPLCELVDAIYTIKRKGKHFESLLGDFLQIPDNDQMIGEPFESEIEPNHNYIINGVVISKEMLQYSYYNMPEVESVDTVDILKAIEHVAIELTTN